MGDELAGKRILVLEDEFYIASDIDRAVRGAGGTVVGPFAQVAEGLASMESETIDAAVLDVSLQDESTHALADKLADMRVACLFVTGYDKDWVARRHGDVPCLTKPVRAQTVVKRLGELLGR